MFIRLFRRGLAACVTDPAMSVRLALSALALAVTLAMPQPGAAQAIARLPKPAVPALVIRDDPGGRVDVRFYQIKELKASGQKVELRGACYSSCTMFLGLRDNVCVAANAQFGFHGPSFYGIPQGQEWTKVWGEFIASYYPVAVQKWYASEVMWSQSMRRLSGAELIRLGVKECPSKA